jgi:hypothetical protein
MQTAIEKSFVKDIQKWVEGYQSDVAANDFATFAFVIEIDDARKNTRKAKKILAECLQRQSVFIQYCATCKLLANDTKANRESIQRFVTLQWFSHSHDQAIPLYKVLFHLADGKTVFLFANDLKDIDFADVYSATCFEYIAVACRRWKTLTKANLRSTLKMIRDDMAFDQYKIRFMIPDESAPGREIAQVFAHCRVEGIPGIDKIAKVRKTNELFGVDVLKWFKP